MSARTAVVLATALTVASSASAAGNTRYDVHGPVHVRLTSGLSYDKTFDPRMRAAITDEGAKIRVDLTGEDRKPCTLRGQRDGATITFPPGQVCPQDELDGVLTSGRGTLVGNDLVLVTHWKVEGDVRVLFRRCT